MRIVSNKIFTGKAKNFDEFIKEASNKNQQNIKTASTADNDNSNTIVESSKAKEVKVASEAAVESSNVQLKDSSLDNSKTAVAECGCSAKKEEEKKEEPKMKKEEKKEESKNDKEEKKEVKESCSTASSDAKNSIENKQAGKDGVIKQGVDWGKLRPVANLTKEQKSKVYNYWRNLYGEAYANAMVQDR
jgi:hypothetical protein